MGSTPDARGLKGAPRVHGRRAIVSPGRRFPGRPRFAVPGWPRTQKAARGFMGAAASRASHACGLDPRCLWTERGPKESGTQRLCGPQKQGFEDTEASWASDAHGLPTCPWDSWTLKFRGFQTLVDRTPDAHGHKDAPRICGRRSVLGPGRKHSRTFVNPKSATRFRGRGSFVGLRRLWTEPQMLVNAPQGYEAS